MEEKSERKVLQKKIYIMLACICIGMIAYALNTLVLTPKYDELRTKISSTATIARNISAVESQKQNYEMILNDSGKNFGNLIDNKDKYISFLGEITMANKLNINKMTVDDITAEGDTGIYSMKVQIELQGDLYNVKNLVQQLYDSETISRINSFSYRLEDNYNLMWMWRSIDDESLVPWWDMTGSTGNISITGPSAEQTPLSADDLLTHGAALCYLEIEFLGIGA